LSQATKNLPEAQSLDRQILFWTLFVRTTRVLSPHLTGAVIGTGGWRRKDSETDCREAACQGSEKKPEKAADSQSSGARFAKRLHCLACCVH